jgi:hypothetical protein
VAWTSIWNANKNFYTSPDKLPPVQGVITSTSFGYKSTDAAHSGSVKRYIVNQFSIFDLLSVISERAVHLSAISAGIWNKMAGGVLENDKNLCEKEARSFCLGIPVGDDVSYENSTDYRITSQNLGECRTMRFSACR